MGTKYSFQKLTQFSQGNNVLDAPPSNIDGFVSRVYVLLHFTWIGIFWTKWVFLPIENPVRRRYSFLQVTQFSQGNNVLDGPASNLDCLILRDKWFSSAELNRMIWNKFRVSPPSKPRFAGIIPFNN
jgi:hypothetical protein